MNGWNSRRPMDNILLSAVLPVYNEQAVLVKLADAVHKALAMCGAPYEIVFVNDGSRDCSGELLDRLAASDSRVRVVHLSRNFGHQAAVQAGLQHARGDAVVLLDSDLQDSPTAIPRFVQMWRAGYEVVYAIRVNRKENVLKRSLFACFHRLLSRISSVPIPADAGNFGLIDRRVVDEIVRLGERDRYLPGLRSWVGFRQTGIEVERLARYDNQPRVNLRGLWRLAKTAVFSFSTFPLSMFYAIGYTALAIFLAVSGFALYCKLFTDLAIPGWTSHMLSACFFGALNALGISMLGEYVVRTYDQVRQRPLYLVSRTVNCSEPTTATPANPRGAQADDDDRQLLARSLQSTASTAMDSGDMLYVELLDRVAELVEMASSCGHHEAAPIADDEADVAIH
jgi:dolichol-phosphate mannosyltransferase